MSDLAATQCGGPETGCGCGCGGRCGMENGCGCGNNAGGGCNCIFLILILPSTV